MPDAFASTFARGLRLLESFNADAPRMTLSQLATATGVDRAVARRLVMTLVQLGYARQTGRSFELTPQVLSLGHAFLSSHGWGSRLTPALDALSIELSETVSISVWSGKKVLTIARSNAAGRHMVLGTPDGELPLHASSAARVLLSELPEDRARSLLQQMDRRQFTAHTLTRIEDILASIRHCRRDGHLIAREELEIGLVAVSVPLRGHDATIIGALNLSSQVNRASDATWEQTILRTMKRSADTLTSSLP
ncbi:MAG: helix-turn-helix domain-containing protein [Burkholderiaceae bacterium]|nr:helix-turn-helix domain-containing protein [Burkholderiaceae bacterium]